MRTIAEDDFKLLRRFVEADSQEAFSQLVDGHINLVYSVCLRETRDPVLAQDVTQAVFLLLFRKAPTIRRGTVLAGWLFNTSRFAAKNAMRQEARRKAMEQSLVEAASQSDGQSNGHSEAWQAIEPLLHEAIASLGARDREAILLRYFGDKSLQEVGLALGTSEAAAQMRVSRAVEKLKRFLQKNGVAVPVAILGAVLLDHAVQAAPVSCAQAVGQTALLSGSATAKAHLISQEVLKSMVMTKWKAASLIAALGTVGVVGTAYVSSGVAHQSAAQPIATPNPAWPSGEPVLQKSKAAYAALSTYNGKTTVRTEAVEDGEKSEWITRANIQFLRPNFLHIEGQAVSNGTYKIVFEDGRTQVEQESYGHKDPLSDAPSLEGAITGMAGISFHASTLIPSALMDLKQSPFKSFENAKLEGQEDIDGTPCQRVSITLPHSKNTFWVDAKTSLLRRFKRERDELDKSKLPPGMKVGKSYFSIAVHDFAIESAS